MSLNGSVSGSVRWIVEERSQFSRSLGESVSVGQLFWSVLTAASFVYRRTAEMCGGSWTLYTDTEGSGIFTREVTAWELGTGTR